MSTRPTRDGWIALLLVAGAGVVALRTGNNLAYLVLGVLLATLIAELCLGAWNLRGLQVVRALPPDLFAEREARGRFVVRNPRRALAARGVRIEEDVGEGSLVDVVSPGRDASVPAAWRFERRGLAHLGAVRLSSCWPFGLVRRVAERPLPGEVVVYPRPRGGGPGDLAAREGSHTGGSHALGAFGDFSGLREYRPGDSVRSIHWPTSARAGGPMVMLRTGEAGEEVLVRVADRRGQAWEAELSRACGLVLRGFSRGASVGLELPEGRFEARSGGAWRQTLLEALARAPAREER